MYEYIKALHVIFIVTWFSGMFYMPRLFIYNTEALQQPEETRNILHKQFNIMMKRLWYGITWPSAVLTLVLGLSVLFLGNWDESLFRPEGRWLLIKLLFVLALYLYHFSLHQIFRMQVKGTFKYSSTTLRMWNEVATVFLIAIVMLAVVKRSISFAWGLAGLMVFIIILLVAIKIYKIIRTKNPG